MFDNETSPDLPGDPTPVPGRFQYRLLRSSATSGERIPDMTNLDRGWVRNTFTTFARHALAQARVAVVHWRHDELDLEHLLLGIFYAAPIALLLPGALDGDSLRSNLEVLFVQGGADRLETIPVTDAVLQVMSVAAEEARDRGLEYLGMPYNRIGLGPLLLALAREEQSSPSTFLAQHGITYSRLRSELLPPAFTF